MYNIIVIDEKGDLSENFQIDLPKDQMVSNYLTDNVFEKRPEKLKKKIDLSVVEKILENANTEYENSINDRENSVIKSSLRNVTFCIPFHFDTIDRLENFLISYWNLKCRVDCEIFIYETGEHRYITDDMIDPVDKYIFIEDDLIFHKTKLINTMAYSVKTDFFCIHDTDIILTDDQIFFAYSKLSIESVDCLIPYNGEYKEIGRNYIDFLYNNLYENPAKLNMKIGKRFHDGEYLGTGGCCFFNKKSFIECGGMNENFTKWGFEDDEIVYRMFALGNSVIRAKNAGGIFHISHATDRNGFSNDHNHDCSENQFNEYNKIKSMNYKELKDYVTSWTEPKVTTGGTFEADETIRQEAGMTIGEKCSV